MLGFLFGVSWTPCGPGLAAMQTLAFQESSAMQCASFLGYCWIGLPFIASGLFLDHSEKLRKFFSPWGFDLKDWHFLIAIGLLQVTGLRARL